MFDALVGRPAMAMLAGRAVRGRSRATGFLLSLLLALVACPAPAGAAGDPAVSTPADTTVAVSDLTQIGLEDLMAIKVTSASRHEQNLSEIAAAVTVIGRDQIRSSGATTLAEVLRLVPGLQVAHIDANMWSISARGFSGRIANKLLLLVDGRSVYSPVFSGVYWDEQDLLLDDIERIEVIRGPGASVWGANAVNGVINVITRDANDSRGTMLSATSGTEELGGGSARWAGPLGAGGAVRVYTRGSMRGSGAVLGRPDAWDSWQAMYAGFRADLPASRSRWTVTGDLRGGSAGQSLDMATDSPPYTQRIDSRTKSRGGNLLASWRRELSSRSDLTVQGYADLTTRNDDVLRSHVETYDLDVKHHAASERHDFIWGMSGRLIRDQLDSTSVLYFTPDHESRRLLSGFAQDEVALANRKVLVTLGARVEATQKTRLDWQPTARALWALNSKHVLWTAVSRAIRTPSIAENRIRYHVSTIATGGPPAVVTIYGDEGFQSEVLVAYEAGYRFAPTPAIMCDLTGFYDEYSRLRTIEPGPSAFVPTPSPHIDVRQIWANEMFGDTRGLEAAAAWNVNGAWKLNASASCLAMRLHLEPGSLDVSSVRSQYNEPRYQLMLQSQLRALKNWRWDATVYQTGRRTSQNVNAYTRLDLGLAWRAFGNTELALQGTNLLQKRHLEDDGVLSGVLPTQVERAVTARVTVGLGTE